MTSIVITPFDPEHTEELKGFLWNVLDRTDFAECMPPSVRIEDVDAIKRHRDRLFAALNQLLKVTIDPLLVGGETLTDQQIDAYSGALAAIGNITKEQL